MGQYPLQDSATGLGNAVKQTPDSGYVITEAMDDTRGYEAFITRVTSSGMLLWSKAYHFDSSYVQGNAGNDIVITRHGFLCFLNQFGLMQTDTNGNVLWVKRYNGIGGDFQFGVREDPYITTTHNGHYLFSVGDCFGNNLNEVDTAGNLIFTKYANVITSDVAETKDKGLMIMGNGPLCGERLEDYLSSPQVGMIKTDSLGNAPVCIINTTGVVYNTDTIQSRPIVFTPLTNPGLKLFRDTINAIQLMIGGGCVSRFGGVKNYNASNIVSIFPNPASDRVNVDLSVPSSISIYNLMGQQMFYESAKATEQNMPQVDVSAYPNGLYFLKAQSATSMQTLKFIVQH